MARTRSKIGIVHESINYEEFCDKYNINQELIVLLVKMGKLRVYNSGIINEYDAVKLIFKSEEVKNKFRELYHVYIRHLSPGEFVAASMKVFPEIYSGKIQWYAVWNRRLWETTTPKNRKKDVFEKMNKKYDEFEKELYRMKNEKEWRKQNEKRS